MFSVCENLNEISLIALVFIIIVGVGLFLTLFGWGLSRLFCAAFLAGVFATAIGFEFLESFGVSVFGFNGSTFPFLSQQSKEKCQKQKFNTNSEVSEIFTRH